MADESLSVENVSKLKVTDLKKVLKERGLSVVGTKSQLAERLLQSITESGAEMLDSSTTEDIGLDDHLEVSLEDDLIKADKKSAVEESAEPPIKKISFNSSEPEPTEKKKIVISAVPESERLKRRAERFGSMSEDARKKARAERFGLTAATTNNTAKTNNIKQSTPIVQTASEIERLKKRAERFGTTVSPALSKVEEQMKLSKRQQRFGILTSTSVNTLKTLSNDDLKKKRAERFGLAK